MLATAMVCALAMGSAPTCSAPAPVCTPVEKWRWQEPGEPPYALPITMTAPLVLQLTDDDGDGRIDARDRPDVAFVNGFVRGNNFYGHLTVLDGATGIMHYAVNDVRLSIGDLAAADLDGDGVVELVGIHIDNGTVHAFRHDGTPFWTSAQCGARLWDVVSIADLDQDGSPEIIAGPAVLDASGVLRWTTAALHESGARIASVADVLPGSPGLEVLAGGTLHAAAGAVLWQLGVAADGVSALGDLDGDGVPEAVIANQTELHVVDANGNPLAPPHLMSGPGGGWYDLIAPPALADIDGDGRSEIIALQCDRMDALELDLGQLRVEWSLPVSDPSRGCSASFFDFNADGALEVLYHDHQHWYLIDGATGVPLTRTPLLSETGWEYPVVSELDGDCDAEIVLSGGQRYDRGYIVAYDCSPSAPARPLWNEQAYHVTNVTDDGRVPAIESPPWSATPPGWHQQSWDPARLLSCAGSCVKPPEVRPVLAVRSGGDASFHWPAPGPDCGFHVWHVDLKERIPEARLGGVPAPVGVAGCSPPSAAPFSPCLDSGAIGRNRPSVLYYQVRARCDARTEGE